MLVAGRNVAIRYSTEGGEKVIQTNKAIGDAGEDAARRYSAAWTRAESDREAATRRAESARAKLETLGIGPSGGAATGKTSAELLTLARNQQVAEKAANSHRAAMTGLSYQAQDTFTQLSMGANPLTVIAIQGAQAAGQMANMGGKMGAVASVLAGPWGLAVSGGLMLLGALTNEFFKSGDAADSKKKKVQTLTESIDELNEATGRQIKSEQAMQEETLRSAWAMRQKATAAREATLETLKATRADLTSAMSRAENPLFNGEFNSGAAAAAGFEQQIKTLDAQLTKQEAAIAKANTTVRQAQVPFLSRRVAETFDGQAAATGKYDRAVDDLNQRYATGAVRQREYDAQMRELTQTRNRETKAAQEQSKTHGAAAGAAIGDTARLAAANTDVRRAEAELSIERRKATADLKAGKITQEEATSRIAAATTKLYEARDAAGEHAKATRDAAAAQRQLRQDLAGVIAQLDPARASADRYAETLGKLAKLRTTGDLTTGDWFDYSMRALKQDDAKKGQEFNQKAVEIFAPKGDPLGITLDGQRVEQERQRAATDDFYRYQAQKVSSLSDLFHTGFTQGAAGIWSSFREQGLRALADLAAKWLVMGKGGGGGLLGSIGKLVGASSKLAGGGAGYSNPFASDGLSFPTLPPAYAAGTHYSSAGAALVGENGPELVNLPRGSRVTPAAETRRLLAANDGPPVTNVTNNFTGNLMTPEFWAQIQASDDMAAMRGAAGGATIGRAEAQAQGARRLGRRW